MEANDQNRVHHRDHDNTSMTRAEALHCTILQCLVGSTAHGLNVQDGLEDRDEMGIMVEGLDLAMPVSRQPFEQFIYRSAAEREGKHDAKSRAGDLDLTIYSLRKWASLALKGNPTVLLPLFAPVTYSDAYGQSLRTLAPSFASKDAGKRFSGYLQAQRERLLGQRGQKDVNRPELVEKYGFDTKYCMHMLRLGVQGIEYLKTGKLELPMREPVRSDLYAVRLGKFTQDHCIEWCRQLEDELESLIQGKSPLPDKPDVERVQKWVAGVYLKRWHDHSTKELYPDHHRNLKHPELT